MGTLRTPIVIALSVLAVGVAAWITTPILLNSLRHQMKHSAQTLAQGQPYCITTLDDIHHDGSPMVFRNDQEVPQEVMRRLVVHAIGPKKEPDWFHALLIVRGRSRVIVRSWSFRQLAFVSLSKYWEAQLVFLARDCIR